MSVRRGALPVAVRALKRLLNTRPKGDGAWRRLFRQYPEMLGTQQVVDFEVRISGLPPRTADFLTGFSLPGTYVLWELEGSDSPVFTPRQGTLVPHWTLTLGLQQLEDWKVAIERYTTADYLRDRCPGFSRMEYRLLIGHQVPDDRLQKLIHKNRFILDPVGLHVMTYGDLLEYWEWVLRD